ncbi:SPFH domain-containing protein [Actinacidiphila bryophytorum]|uniref:SPFH domain / Band 7 family protein n=1 Tax=Actinacidiphila bryophytorum TaxID=1436133 RepID=A0A9W4GW62_9ACTN|nr:SPFH domain-containing protein [Actinacidiphila bryophytorum]MBM9440105.1 SPFH domain-containing protein [Actinacidiphila bryophytorum]MBN6543952.1 SPFH domain-containing protein [Actinacidiphila bryophytorum]CAG7602665.1 SPFH domain / Band 7 family protein [Actinacidiphila bryophytorum]
MSQPTAQNQPRSTGDPAIPAMPAPRVQERRAVGMPGLPFLLIALLVVLGGAALIAVGGVHAKDHPGALATTLIALGVVIVVGALLTLFGLTQVAPGQARVCQLFGRYQGTIRQDGLRWVNPLTSRRKISTRLRNHETAVLKVNDAYGNPIELAAVVVWQVADTAQAVFEVDNYANFVGIQTDTAVRHIATNYPYDAHDDRTLSLRGNSEDITERLSAEIAARVESAGVRIIESRFTHLAYAPEIASAMLQRQQAGAIVAARQTIVDGAVGMVESALSRIAEQDIVDLDEERKASMVSNLLVVLCGDRAAQPVLNTGTLYQ